MLKGLGALFVIIVVIVAIANEGGGKKSSDGDDATAASSSTEMLGDNMDGRSRYFVNQMRHCTRAVGILAAVIQIGGSSDVELADAVSTTRDNCDAARDNMALADTSHFSDQALSADVALNEFRDGLKDVSDYLDTLAPSKAANARNHFRRGRTWMRQALAAINHRRAIYGAPPIG